MLRVMSKLIKTSTSVITRRASLGLPANVANARQHISHNSRTVPFRQLASITANNSKLEPKIERKLGVYENFFFKTGREKGWSHFTQCVVFRSESELTSEHFRKALRNLQRRHAVLRMAVTVKNGENHFAEVPDAPEFRILQTKDRRAVVSNEEQEWMTYGQLLWRSKLLQPETSDQGFLYPIIFTFHACIFDETTVFANLFPDLVNFLEASLEQDDGCDDTRSVPLLPAREHILEQYANRRFEKVTPDWGCNKDLALKLHEMHKPAHPEPRSGNVSFILDKEQTSRLLYEAAKRDVTLNSVCVAAHAMALYRLLIDLGLLTDEGWSLLSPFVVDIRSYTVPETRGPHSGVCVGELCNNILIPSKMAGGISNEASWELAASIKKETRELLANREALLSNMKAFTTEFYNSFQADPEAFYRSCYPVQDLFYLSILENSCSSSGTIPTGRGQVGFDKTELQTGNREPIMFCHMIHRLNSSYLLHWELSYSKMLVSDELAETYVSLVKGELQRYLL